MEMSFGIVKPSVVSTTGWGEERKGKILDLS